MNQIDSDDSMHTLGRIEIDATKFDKKPDLKKLPILPTRNLVLFPGVIIPLSLGRESSIKLAEKASKECFPIGVVCQLDSTHEQPAREDLSAYGVIADVLNVFELPDGSKTALLKARGKFRLNDLTRQDDMLFGEVRRMSDKQCETKEFQVTVNQIKSIFSEIIGNMPDHTSEEVKANMHSYKNDAALIDYICTVAMIEPADKIALLAMHAYSQRAAALLSDLHVLLDMMKITREVNEKAKNSMAQGQRNMFLQQQMETIRQELYGEADDVEQLRQRRKSVALTEAAAKVFDKEIARLQRYSPQTPDFAVLYSYLETLLDLPWGKFDEVNPDFNAAEKIMENDHYGLEKVKDRILEQIALILENPDGHAPILSLVGPAGVGKTSLGRSIASALGRKYQRVSLGGLHDEAEIRGHRRTYIGAMPGRIIDAVRRAGVANPVILLDEVDKIGRDFKGDPEAALLEVLDPEQNKYFHDNYVDVDFDLSQVLFIATANTLSTLQQPLLDRLEVIELSGYLVEEKVEIARRHLLPKIMKQLGLDEESFKISDSALQHIIEEYTSESGVRQLEKKLSAIGRRAVLAKARKIDDFPKVVEAENLGDLLGVPLFDREKYEGNDYPGVVTGLAWTSVGGTILLAEVSLSEGKGERVTVTGNLGDVMKESSQIALQWVKTHHAECGIDKDRFASADVHIHFPEGAIPKDGPSAGITMATAIASAFSGRKVRERIAMTGELTLRGRVLPVGGIKEKILAAKRAGITDIILSKDNRKNIEDIPERYRSGLTFHYVTTMSEVVKLALLP